jgi:hypothetical protein
MRVERIDRRQQGWCEKEKEDGRTAADLVADGQPGTAVLRKGDYRTEKRRFPFYGLGESVRPGHPGLHRKVKEPFLGRGIIRVHCSLALLQYHAHHHWSCTTYAFGTLFLTPVIVGSCFVLMPQGDVASDESCRLEPLSLEAD